MKHKYFGLLLALVGITLHTDCRAESPVTESQDKPQAGVLAGHSMHGDAFNEGPRQRAYLMRGTGNVHFAITTKVPEAHEFFNQGVGQLHGFWYYEAERSFRQVAALDPDCAMAYWGMARANINNRKRSKEFIKKAVERKGYASPREQKWIDSWNNYMDDKGDDKSRRTQLVKALEAIIFEFPDDVEAKAFLAMHIWENAGSLPISSHQAVQSLIDAVYAMNPVHPAHHYQIHLWDNEKAERAVTSAARCGQTAPAIAHMWHMSGHTFSKLQRYADAVWQQEASARVDHAYMMRDRVLPDQIHNYAHNNQWLVEDLEYIGRAHDAIALAKNLIELPRHPKYNTFNVKEDGTSYDRNRGSSFEGRRRLLETLTRYELWNELIALADTIYLEPTDIESEQVKRLRLLGVSHFERGNVEKGQAQITELESRIAKLREERHAAADKAETKAKSEKKSDADVNKAMADAMASVNGRIKPMETALAELRGCVALAAGDKVKAEEQFTLAGDIPKDRLARQWLAAGDKEKAEKLASEMGGANSKQVCLAANFIDILYRCGKEDEAKEQFKKLRELAAAVDLDMPVMQRLAPLAKALELPADWRVPHVIAPDVGDRPNLDSLGPFRWQPSPAPKWELPDSAGKTVSLADYRGKPVIIIFFLGVGCAHCVEQLNVFDPMVDEFRSAGISIVAVSSDSVEGLKTTFEKTKLVEKVPLVSDHEMKTFRAYRAFDEFENAPLHGTFLIDADGLVRWQDISFEPFRDVRFLLGESKRLLAQPKPQPLTASASAP